MKRRLPPALRAQFHSDGERFSRLGVIKRADVGAEGSEQVIVSGGSTIDESEVRLVVVEGPPVVGVGGVAGRPHGERLLRPRWIR